ncbi:MAG: recombinase family protein [Candidatus Dormibacteria bacterium]
MKHVHSALPTTAIGYVRVSTAEQAEGGLGLDAQRAAITAACREKGWELATICEDAGISSAARSRPGLDAALAACGAAPGAVLVVAKLDRLARSFIGYAHLVERAQGEHWRLYAMDAPETDTPHGAAMQQMVAVFAQLERSLISQRTKDALAAARARGVRLGRPPEVDPGVEATILSLYRHRHWSATAIAAHLTAAGTPSPRGAQSWSPATVAGLLRRHGHALKRGRPGRRGKRGARKA